MGNAILEICHGTNLNICVQLTCSKTCRTSCPGQPTPQQNCERSIKLYLAAMATPEDVVLQFRAGLMKAENNTLKADQRKGLVRLSQVLTTQHSHVVDGAHRLWSSSTSELHVVLVAGRGRPPAFPMV